VGDFYPSLNPNVGYYGVLMAALWMQSASADVRVYPGNNQSTFSCPNNYIIVGGLTIGGSSLCTAVLPWNKRQESLSNNGQTITCNSIGATVGSPVVCASTCSYSNNQSTTVPYGQSCPYGYNETYSDSFQTTYCVSGISSIYIGDANGQTNISCPQGYAMISNRALCNPPSGINSSVNFTLNSLTNPSNATCPWVYRNPTGVSGATNFYCAKIN
jgi:hypothetical protein